MIYFLAIAAIIALICAIRADRRAEQRQALRDFEQFNSRTGIHPADDIYDYD